MAEGHVLDGVPRVHANAMQALGGPFDVTLEFGYRWDPEREPDPQARVTMSWEHAKAMAQALVQAVENYEQQVGNLPDVTAVRREDVA